MAELNSGWQRNTNLIEDGIHKTGLYIKKYNALDSSKTPGLSLVERYHHGITMTKATARVSHAEKRNISGASISRELPASTWWAMKKAAEIQSHDAAIRNHLPATTIGVIVPDIDKRRIYNSPKAWLAADLNKSREWIIEFDNRELAAIRNAIQSCRTRSLGITRIDKDDFDLGIAHEKVMLTRQLLVHGKGVALLKGLSIQDMTKEEAGIMFWGLGAHLGRAVAQNAYGDLLGHVWNLGKDFTTDTSARGYQSNLKLNFHTDTTDIVGLLCLRSAKSGGLSSIASSAAIHNHMLQTAPELLNVLYDDFYWDQRDEESAGLASYLKMPVCIRKHDELFIRYIKTYIESAQRFEGVPPLTNAQKQALEMVTGLAHEPRFRFDMDLQPGDIQLLNNYSVLHSRTAYEDFDSLDQRRHLLRLWLFVPEYDGRRPDEYRPRHALLEKWRENPREPIYDIKMIMQPNSVESRV